MNRARDFVGHEDGAAAVEFAIIGLLLILVSVGTIEVGRALWLYNELAYAADHAARLVMINPGATDELLQSKWETKKEQEPFLVGLPELIPDFGGEPSGGFREVTLEYQFEPMVSGLTLTDVTLSTIRRVPVN